MKIIQRFFVSVFLIFLVGCSPSLDYEYLADQASYRTAKQLHEQKELYLFGTGGEMMGDIQMMDIAFHYYHIVNIEEARNLIIYAAQMWGVTK